MNRRAWAGLNLAAAVAVILLSLVHTFVFGGIASGPVTGAEVWFAGTGLAMFLVGLANLARVRDAGRSGGLRLVSGVGAVLLLGLALIAAEPMGGFGAWQIWVQIALYGILAAGSAAAPARPSAG